ncbi:MAG: hypothetical protein P4L75_04430 [Clostridia bacterium]|nr:hypothetical protein [Clostridia bacterium]MDR3643682.1 hypothetical protein [Clostridia bacterium]
MIAKEAFCSMQENSTPEPTCNRKLGSYVAAVQPKKPDVIIRFITDSPVTDPFRFTTADTSIVCGLVAGPGADSFNFPFDTDANAVGEKGRVKITRHGYPDLYKMLDAAEKAGDDS